MDYRKSEGVSSDARLIQEPTTKRVSLVGEKKKRWLPLSQGSAGPTMLGLLVVGMVAAIGHFFYYQQLNGQRLSSSSVSQEWNIRIGTALAFVAKTCWTVAVITAQAQQVWLTVDQKQLGLKTIDAMLTATSDFLAFRRGSMLAKAKVATLIALVAWLIPLGAIFTPATLTVVPNDRASSRLVQQTVPNIDFESSEKFASLATCSASSCGLATEPEDGIYSAVQFRYPNAQTIVQIVSTTASGRVQSMDPQYPNSTYATSFPGPLFQCETANSSTVAQIDKIDKRTAPSNESFYYSGTPSVSYYAFVPGKAPNGSTVALDFAQLPTGWDDIDNATVPTSPELWIKSGEYGKEDHHVCTFYNSTYNVNFTFSSGIQTTRANFSSEVTRLPYVIGLPRWPDDGADPVGYQFRILSYQAVFIALATQLIGRFTSNPLNTQLFQTPVVGAAEFNGYFESDFGAASQPFAYDLTITQVIEQLSQNITLSMLASSSHTGNGTKSQVTVYDSENVYSFNKRDLILTYVLTFAGAVACVVVGIVAVMRNKGTRTTAFSALVQAAKQSQEGDSLSLQEYSHSINSRQ